MIHHFVIRLDTTNKVGSLQINQIEHHNYQTAVKTLTLLRSFSINSWSWVLNLLPTLTKVSLPFWAIEVAKSVWINLFLLSWMILSSDACNASLFLSMNCFYIKNYAIKDRNSKKKHSLFDSIQHQQNAWQGNLHRHECYGGLSVLTIVAIPICSFSPKFCEPPQ